MTQFKSFEEGVEVNGQTILAMVKGMNHSRKKALEILSEHGLLNPQKDEWFSQQSWLDAFREIADDIGEYALYCIGVKIPESAEFPPGINSLEEALDSINVAYQMNHRGGEIGYYKFYKSEDGALRFTCNNPYHCEFDRGLIEGIARKFVEKGKRVVVKHDDPGPCRNKGDDSCTYRIELID